MTVTLRSWSDLPDTPSAKHRVLVHELRETLKRINAKPNSGWVTFNIFWPPAPTFEWALSATLAGLGAPPILEWFNTRESMDDRLAQLRHSGYCLSYEVKGPDSAKEVWHHPHQPLPDPEWRY